MYEWPEEKRRRTASNPDVKPILANIRADFLRELEGTEAFAFLVSTLTQAIEEEREPQTTLAALSAQIARPDAFGDYEEAARDAVLSLAAIAVMRAHPSRGTWEYLRSLAYYSATLEHLLPQTTIVAAEDPSFRQSFFAVAHDLIQEAARNPGRRAIERDRSLGLSLKARWEKVPSLYNLWHGRYDRGFHILGRDDDYVLFIVASIDPSAFLDLLELYTFPDPVVHALFWHGGALKFERWRELTELAPLAFDKDGRWNGSLILPILLLIARDQSRVALGHTPTPAQVAEATADIKALAATIAKTIALRGDALGSMTRWGNWLTQGTVQALSSNTQATNPPIPVNASSNGFVDSALLDALIAEMPARVWRVETSADTESWEPWCHFTTGALVALAGKTAMPSISPFLEEWRFRPEGWSTKQGTILRQNASAFASYAPRADGYGARLLALPLVEGGPADETWHTFWSATVTLREIVEFGDVGESSDDGWQARSEASRLLILQFSIGLMMLDHLIIPQRQLSYDRRVALGRLFPLLNEALREMMAIDALNRKFWLEAVRHLALRRLLWDSGSKLDQVTFDPSVSPTFSDFLSDLAGDTENLLALTYVALRNNVAGDVLANAFTLARVDFSAELVLAEKLQEIAPKTIGLDQEKLDVVKRFAHDFVRPN